MFPSEPIAGGSSFPKEEKLCSKKLFGLLFQQGQKINQFPFRMIFLENELEVKVPAQIAFSVPKRNFKKAVDRNKIKRWMREVYRKNKTIHLPFLLQSGKQFAILFVYIGNQVPDYSITEEKIKLLLNKFAEGLKNNIG